ncbi:MAG: hypothetical protein AAF202_07485 [Pseudomonadota bacterium]
MVKLIAIVLGAFCLSFTGYAAEEDEQATWLGPFIGNDSTIQIYRPKRDMTILEIANESPPAIVRSQQTAEVVQVGDEISTIYDSPQSMSFVVRQEAVKVSVQLTDLKTDIDVELKVDEETVAGSDNGENDDEAFSLCLPAQTAFTIDTFAFGDSASTEDYSFAMQIDAAEDCDFEPVVDDFDTALIQSTPVGPAAAFAVQLGKLDKSNTLEFIGAIGKKVIDGELLDAPEVRVANFEITAPTTVLSQRLDVVIAKIELTNLQGDLELKIVNRSGQKPSNVNCNLQSCESLNGSNSPEMISAEIPRGETVFVRIEGASSEVVSQYKLKVTTEEPKRPQGLNR